MGARQGAGCVFESARLVQHGCSVPIGHHGEAVQSQPQAFDVMQSEFKDVILGGMRRLE